MANERRQFRRIPVGAAVSYQELSFSGEIEPSESVYLDVSGGGLLLASPREFPLGTLLKLDIRVPGWGKHQASFAPAADKDLRPLVAVGQVVRVEQLDAGGFELGIKFVNVYPDDQAALFKFVDASAAADEL